MATSSVAVSLRHAKVVARGEGYYCCFYFIFLNSNVIYFSPLNPVHCLLVNIFGIILLSARNGRM